MNEFAQTPWTPSHITNVGHTYRFVEVHVTLFPTILNTLNELEFHEDQFNLQMHLELGPLDSYWIKMKGKLKLIPRMDVRLSCSKNHLVVVAKLYPPHTLSNMPPTYTNFNRGMPISPKQFLHHTITSEEWRMNKFLVGGREFHTINLQPSQRASPLPPPCLPSNSYSNKLGSLHTQD